MKLNRFVTMLAFVWLPYFAVAQTDDAPNRDAYYATRLAADTLDNGSVAQLSPGIKSPVGTPYNGGRMPFFIAGRFAEGKVLESNEFVRGENAIDKYWNASLKFGVSSVGNRWQDIAYGMPYYGVALEISGYGRKKDLGTPISLYFLQGATMAKFSKRLELKYEWNLGVSNGWKSYDPLNNPYNMAIGSGTTAHIGYNLFLNLSAFGATDIRFGAGVSHDSNGAAKLPNAGINNIMLFVEAAYNFNRKTVRDEYDPSLRPPPYNKHTSSEIMVTVSSRQTSIDNRGTGLPSRYIDKNFNVFNLSYAFIRAPHYRYRYGVGVDMLYDESAGVTAERIEVFDYDYGYESYDRVYLGDVHERLSLGLYARGEVVLPGYSVFANLGYQVINGNEKENDLYQVAGVKIYLKENFFGTFGIRATRFGKATFLFWSLGYTIDHRRLGRR